MPGSRTCDGDTGIHDSPTQDNHARHSESVYTVGMLAGSSVLKFIDVMIAISVSDAMRNRA